MPVSHLPTHPLTRPDQHIEPSDMEVSTGPGLAHLSDDDERCLATYCRYRDVCQSLYYYSSM